MRPSTAVDRTQFLQGDLHGQHIPLRPPWAVPERLFDEKCDNCGKCIDICPEQILKFGRGRLPVVNFQRGACTFCGECLRVCESGALNKNGDPPWRLKALLSAGCLATKGVMCRSCGDACEEDAIRFRLIVGGFSQPEIEHCACTGCGACVAPCPEGVIRIRPYIPTSEEAEPPEETWEKHT